MKFGIRHIPVASGMRMVTLIAMYLRRGPSQWKEEGVKLKGTFTLPLTKEVL
jgi:hypothetical protein